MATLQPQPARIQSTAAAASAPPARSLDVDQSDPSADVTAAALLALFPEWQLALRAENKAPGTIAVYTDGAQRYLAWCQRTQFAPMIRTTLQTWMAHLLDAGSAPGTVRTRHQAVRRFTVWVIATGTMQADPFWGIKGPVLRQKMITPLSDAELRALIGTCTSPTFRVDEPFHHRRDKAIIRLMMETGIRAGETIALQVGDVDLDAGRVTIRRGKGGRGRVVPVGATTSAVLRAYLNLRARHRCADSLELWLGERGTRFGYDGLSRALRRRAARAGIAGFHPHKLRHTAAHRWLAAGGSESGLMAIAGWTRTDMLVRYTRAHASGRATYEAARLNLGEI
jgi:site-specific recombinase XerD